MKKENSVHVFETPIELAESACRLIVEISKTAIETSGKFTIVLSGGHTPEQLFVLLSKPPSRDEIPWDKTFVFWGDERCVPLNDELNNARKTIELLLDLVDIPKQNIFRIPVNHMPEVAATKYEDTIMRFFGDEPSCFDLILLGLGENGHTASLFPGNDSILESSSLVKETYVAEQKMFRITMTPALINQAYNIVFLVEGENKAEILKQVLSSNYQPNKYPAQLINPINGNLRWFLDKKAASLLQR